jgi:hypothetical protein
MVIVFYIRDYCNYFLVQQQPSLFSLLPYMQLSNYYFPNNMLVALCLLITLSFNSLAQLTFSQVVVCIYFICSSQLYYGLLFQNIYHTFSATCLCLYCSINCARFIPKSVVFSHLLSDHYLIFISFVHVTRTTHPRFTQKMVSE